MTAQLDRAYRDARDALLDCLNQGHVDSEGLRSMQAGMANIARNRTAFGAARYDELRELLDAVERLPIREPVLLNREPLFGHEHARQMRPWRQIPYPYRFKNDGPWLFVLCLFVGGFAFPALWVIAAVIALLRIVAWSSFRFPLTTAALLGLCFGLFGGGRRGRW